MPFVVLTPLSASTADNMSARPSSPSARLRLHNSTSESAAARNSIISSSAKGWSPLQIQKRDGAASPLKGSPNPGNPIDSPRRTSNSFKHVTRNSLVANSPFKNINTVQGAQAAGMDGGRGKEVIHERRAAGTVRSLGQTLPTAAGSASTPKAAIGLGISAKPRTSGSAVAGTRKVSMERGKASVYSTAERRVSGGSGERRVSGADKASKENESPSVRSGKAMPRQSSGLKGLKEQNFVSRSPFTASRRIPSMELSPTPSPKTVSSSRQATPSSPSPRRTSGGGQRKVSPAQARARQPRSPSPSPSRSLSHAQQPLATGPSPLKQSHSGRLDEPVGRPTPSKSAMTPSRRLLGPRTHGTNDSPSKQAKTVTFQSVPDVKEFERMSVEGTPDLDRSFELEDNASDHDRDWVDEIIDSAANGGSEGDSLEEILLPEADDDNDDDTDIRDKMRRMRLGGSADDTPEASPNPNNDASMTADFVNTLIEEGLFTPVIQHTPAIADQVLLVVDEATPLSEHASEAEEEAPYLSTPSLGEQDHFPSFDIAGDSDSTSASKGAERDSAGIPYGRTHHAERANLAHSLPPLSTVSPIVPPDLPANEDHHMLLNANAAEPSLPTISPSKPIARISHQAEPLHDPFITIQTATSVLSPPKDRAEDGIPLGRTSHAERVNAARILASQQIGLGMPRSPGLGSAPNASGDNGREEDMQSESGSEVESGSDDDERFFAPTPVKGKAAWQGVEVKEAQQARQATPVLKKRLSAQEIRLAEGREKVDEWRSQVEDTPRRGLPKPPRPQEVGVPSPVETQVAKDEDHTDKRSSKLDFSGFSLPAISMSSPFFRTTPQVLSAPRIPSTEASEQSTEDDDKPLTPPPSAARLVSGKDESPHRIPSFEFEEIKLTSEEPLVRRATVSKNPYSPVRATFVSLDRDREEEEAMMREMMRAHPGLVLSPKKKAPVIQPVSAPAGQGKGGATAEPVKVRQRISREMIRETIDRKYADGSISRKAPARSGPTASMSQESQVSDASKQSSVIGKYTTSVAPPVLTSPTAPSGPSPPATKIALAAAKPPTPPPGPSAPNSGLGREKDLPPPPAATPMLKSATEIPSHTGGRVVSRPRSNTQAVPPPTHRASSYDPTNQSGLDRIIAGNHHQLHMAPTAGLPPRTTAYGPSAQSGLPISLVPGPGPNTSRVGATSPTAPTKGPRPFSVLGQFDGTAVAPYGSQAREKPAEGEMGKVGSTTQDQRGSRRSRRSMSMSDALNEGQPPSTRKQPRLTLGLGDQKQSIAAAIENELSAIDGDRNYRVRERHVTTASFGNTVSHAKAGDIDGGRAWRQLRRPSDINEHAAEIRAMRERNVSMGKATGTIFVKVLGIESLVIPVPSQATYFCVTLDNGIDYIRTPYTVFQDGARVNQEFALVEHPNFEFSLSLDIRRDPHIIRSLQDQTQQTIAQRQPSLTVSHAKTPSSSSGGGIRNLFSSPRKPKASAPPAPPSRSITPHPPQAPPHTIARYFATANSSTVAKTHVVFKPIARQCEAKVLEIRYPMFAMFKGEPDRPREGDRGIAPPGTPRKQVGKITLQILRLPPLPGVDPADLPQCIDECLRGMRHHAWHEVEYHEGILTQVGGDCTNPRRRMFKLIGGSLVAYNEITRKEVTTIDLKQAISVTDLNPDTGRMSPQSRMNQVDEEGLFGVRPRSFRVEFRGGEGISFSADKDEDKAVWMDTLNGLIGKIPSNPLWAELLATRLRERNERHAARSASRSTMASSTGQSHAQGQHRRAPSHAHARSQHGHSMSHDQGAAAHPGRQVRHQASVLSAGSGSGSSAESSGQGRRREVSQGMAKTRSAPSRQQQAERKEHVEV